MGKLIKSKILTRIFAIFISFIMVATSVATSAYAENEAVSRGINIEMTALNEAGDEKTEFEDAVSVPMGETGTFRLKAENTSVEQQTIQVKIRLPEELFETSADGEDTDCYIEQFKGNKTEYSNGGNTFQLIKEEDGMHYLSFVFSEGSTIQQNFDIAFTNGITEPKTVRIGNNDIILPPELEGKDNVSKSGGAIFFSAYFDWENVRISSNPTEVQVGNGQKTSVEYMIQNTSLNQTELGEIFTSAYDISETITLPDYISFPEGELTLDPGETTSTIKIGNQVIATIGGKVTAAAVDGKVLTFTVHYDNPKKDQEVSNPNCKVKLDNLIADAQGIKDYYEDSANAGKKLEITNKTEFTATSVFGETKESTAQITTPIGNPAEAWSVSKESLSLIHI